MSSRPASLKLMYFDGRGAMEVTRTMLVRSIWHVSRLFGQYHAGASSWTCVVLAAWH
jgi:hypothetical protein